MPVRKNRLGNYYPYGAPLPGRSVQAGSYRYGYNGKENDKEVKGEGNQQDYGMRIYDPRLGRFLSVDPLQKNFPWFTPYQYAGNNPIANVDLDGLENANYNLVLSKNSSGKPCLTIQYDKTEEPDFIDGIVNGFLGREEGQPTHSVLYYQGEAIAVFNSFQEMKQVVHGRTVGQIKQWESERQTGILKEVAIAHMAESAQATITTAVEAKIAASGSVLKAVEARTVAANGGNIAKVSDVVPGVLKNLVKYSGFGGDLIVRSDKITTVLGKYKGGIENLKASGAFDLKGLNFLNSEKWTWKKNLQFLDNAINNNHIIRTVSDPRKAENLFQAVDGKLTNQLSIYGREIKYLEDAGYRFNSALNTFEKGLKDASRITK